MKTIFLDFDGVLFDSVKEAYLLSRYAYDNILPIDDIDFAEYKRFHKFRYLITKSWQFYYILKLIKENVSDECFESEYNKYIDKKEYSLALEFDKEYVQARECLIKEMYEFWDKLDEPFPFFYEILKLSQNRDYKFIILTNKKKLPILNKLKKYKFSVDVYANEDLIEWESKAEFINHYALINKLKECYLIEDSIENLKQCDKYPFINQILVNWGYIYPNSKSLNIKSVLNKIKEM